MIPKNAIRVSSVISSIPEMWPTSKLMQLASKQICHEERTFQIQKTYHLTIQISLP